MPFWPLQGYLIRFCVHLHRHLFFVATNLTWCHTRFNDSLNCATSPIGNFLFAFCSIISIVSHGSAAAIRHHLASGIYNVILFIRLFLLPVLVYVKRLPVKESVSHTCAVAGGVPSLFPFFYIWNKTLYSLYSHFLLFYVFLFRGAFFLASQNVYKKINRTMEESLLIFQGRTSSFFIRSPSLISFFGVSYSTYFYCWFSGINCDCCIGSLSFAGRCSH